MLDKLDCFVNHGFLPRKRNQSLFLSISKYVMHSTVLACYLVVTDEGLEEDDFFFFFFFFFFGGGTWSEKKKREKEAAVNCIIDPKTFQSKESLLKTPLPLFSVEYYLVNFMMNGKNRSSSILTVKRVVCCG